ncbi:MAG: hypothetical protein K2P81_10335 [Bacteriovoracaceae bacterium]|nr:hypothetical protein [Bacteriovoracaceae bacterium]
MFKFFVGLILIPFTLAQAALTVSDKQNLASVTLHTELIPSSKRVYLAADFEANHKAGLIGCQLSVEHKNGQDQGPTYRLEEATSLLPNERISFNMGLFPDRFHASGLDVKAQLICKRVTFFDKQKKTPKTTMLKSTDTKGSVCCRMSPLHLNCALERDNGSIDVDRSTQLNLAVSATEDYSPCWPETN